MPNGARRSGADTAGSPGYLPGAGGGFLPWACGFWSRFGKELICRAGPRLTKGGRLRPNLQARLNLTTMRNGSRLNAYVQSATFRAASAFSPCPAQFDHPRGGDSAARHRVCDVTGWSPQYGGRHSGFGILCAVSHRHRFVGRHRLIAGVRHHGTVPAFSLKPKWARVALGRIAQLVQSACLTRRMSGVRIPLRP